MTYEEAVRKAVGCLKLSKSTNADEAALAASMAQKIIEKYKLDVTALDYDGAKIDDEPIKDFGFSDPLEKVAYVKSWMIRLATIVARANECRAVFVRADLTEAGDSRNRGCIIKIVGRPSDASATRYIHSYLRGEVVRLRDENCAGNSNTYKRQFALGVVEAIAVKLKAANSEAVAQARSDHASNALALVRINQAVARRAARESEMEAYLISIGSKKTSASGQARTLVGQLARHHGRQVGAEQVRMTKAKGSIGG